jgi:hypothetical protein
MTSMSAVVTLSVVEVVKMKRAVEEELLEGGLVK